MCSSSRSRSTAAQCASSRTAICWARAISWRWATSWACGFRNSRRASYERAASRSIRKPVMGGNLPDPITLVALIVAFGVAPFVALMMTSYTKLVIVFGLLRTALGLQQTPPNMVLNGLAIILSIYIMAPIGMEVGDALRGRNFGARGEGLADVVAVIDAAKTALRRFLQKHTQERDRRFFLKSAESIWRVQRVATLSPDDYMVLVPSFTLSELTRAFQIGFVIY